MSPAAASFPIPSLGAEMGYLALASILLLVQLVLQASLLTRQLGRDYNVSPRDERRQVTGLAGRAERAFANLMETFPLFAAVALALEVSGKADGWTALGAGLYFWARVAYLPLYLAGIAYWRSVVWIAATLGIVIMLWQLVF